MESIFDHNPSDQELYGLGLLSLDDEFPLSADYRAELAQAPRCTDPYFLCYLMSMRGDAVQEEAYLAQLPADDWRIAPHREMMEEHRFFRRAA